MSYEYKKWAESLWLAASVVVGVAVTAAVPHVLQVLANYDPAEPLGPTIGVAVGASVRAIGAALLAFWAAQQLR